MVSSKSRASDLPPLNFFLKVKKSDDLCCIAGQWIINTRFALLIKPIFVKGVYSFRLIVSRLEFDARGFQIIFTRIEEFKQSKLIHRSEHLKILFINLFSEKRLCNIISAYFWFIVFFIRLVHSKIFNVLFVWLSNKISIDFSLREGSIGNNEITIIALNFLN